MTQEEAGSLLDAMVYSSGPDRGRVTRSLRLRMRVSLRCLDEPPLRHLRPKTHREWCMAALERCALEPDERALIEELLAQVSL